jgi:hypothetical protein
MHLVKLEHAGAEESKLLQQFLDEKYPSATFSIEVFQLGVSDDIRVKISEGYRELHWVTSPVEYLKSHSASQHPCVEAAREAICRMMAEWTG